MTNAQYTTGAVKNVVDTIWRRRLIVVAVFSVLLAFACYAVLNMPRHFSAGANVLVVNGNTRDDPTLSSPDLPSIATSTVVLDRVQRSLNLPESLLAIKRHLTVKPPAYRSSILRIEYMDTDAARSALIANGVADELVKYYRQVSTARYDADLGALNSELAEESTRINRLSAQMQAQGGSAVNAVDDKGTDPSAGRLETLQTERELAKASLAGDQAVASAVGVDPATAARQLRRDVLQNDQHYQDLLRGLSTNELALATMRDEYTAEHPSIVGVKQKIASLNASLKAEAQRAMSAPDAFSPAIATSQLEQRKAGAVVVADQARVAALERLVAGEEARQAAQTPLEALRLRRDAAQSEYLAISARRATALANRADALSLGSVDVVDRAIPAEVQTGLGRTSLAVALTVLILGVAIASAFVADLFDTRLRRVGQIESLYGRPVVSTIGK